MSVTELRRNAYVPRCERDAKRIRRAAEAARPDAKIAMEVALAQIGAAFDETAAVNAFKIRIERLLRLGAYYPAVRARFGARAGMLFGHRLDAAVILVERCWRAERKAFQIASAFGCGTRLSLEVLRELRLILRLLRRKRMEAEYGAALAALCDAPIAKLAAE